MNDLNKCFLSVLIVLRSIPTCDWSNNYGIIYLSQTKRQETMCVCVCVCVCLCVYTCVYVCSIKPSSCKCAKATKLPDNFNAIWFLATQLNIIQGTGTLFYS